MIFKDLNGKEYKLKIVSSPRENASKLHSTAESMILELYPAIVLCHEIPIKIDTIKKQTLFLDIFLPSFKIGFEIQGHQHYNQVAFFHSDKRAFFKQQNVDQLKRSWCDINSIYLVELKYDTTTKWRDQIRSAIECHSR